MRRRLFILMLFSVALKLWLVAGQPVVAHANASFDDRLFLALAEQILKGDWLGPYSQFTLMKGPMYSVFIAAAYIAHVPLPAAQHVLYLCGCVLVVLALRPCFTAPWQAPALFTLMWWQPMSYFELDVLRQNIYTPLTLLLFAGLIAVQTRQQFSLVARLLWGGLLGVSAAAFYLTREEGIWIVPGAALLLAWAVVSSWRSAGQFWRTVAQIAVALALGIGIVSTVCALNLRYYGWFGTVEFRAHDFVAAYGALQRPLASKEVPYVPVTRDVRLKLYDVSPAFAELRPCLEGSVGQEWANYSDYLTGRPGAELQIGGGSFMWALRDCVGSLGHADTARDALQFYRLIANQVNAACDDGRVGPCRNRRDTMLPRSKPGQIDRLLKLLPGYATDFFLFRGFTAYPTESWGSADLLELFQRLTRWELAPSNEAPEIASPVSQIDHFRLSALQIIGETVRWFCVAAVFTGIITWLLAAIRLVRDRRLSYRFLVSTAALGSAVAVLAINVLVHALAFRNQGPTALHEGYPLLILFGITACFELIAQSNAAGLRGDGVSVTG